MRLLLSVFHRRQQPRRLVHKNFHSISRRLAYCFKNFNPLKTEWSEVVVGLLLLHHHHHPLPGWRRDTVPPTKCNVHSIKWLRTSRPLWKEKHHSQTMSEFLSWRRNGFNKKSTALNDQPTTSPVTSAQAPNLCLSLSFRGQRYWLVEKGKLRTCLWTKEISAFFQCRVAL